MRSSFLRFSLLVGCLGALPGTGLAGAQTPGTMPASTAHARRPASGTSDERLGRVRGTAVDRSGGVLPGVNVLAKSADGRKLAETITDTNGEFGLDRLLPGPAVLVFHLDGFVDSSANVTIHPGSQTEPEDKDRLVHSMDLAALEESVVVRADPPAPPPPPRPSIVPVPVHDEMSVCGPARAEAPPPSFGTLASHRSESTRGLFAAGDEVLIDGGTSTGLEVGDNLIVRRQYQPPGRTWTNRFVMGEHSSGLLQIVSVAEHSSTAVVVYVCDAMMAGDFLVKFQSEPIRPADPIGSPLFDLAARILFADAGELVGVTNRKMVIDRGSQRGVRRGQRLTLFRRPLRRGSPPTVVGDALVVAVRADSATILIERATDAVFFGEDGDLAAPQQPPLR